VTKIGTGNSVSNFLVLYGVIHLKHDMSFVALTTIKVYERS